MMFRFYLWVMGWSGQLSAWAWREHVKILKDKQQIEHDKMIRNQENIDVWEKEMGDKVDF